MQKGLSKLQETTSKIGNSYLTEVKNFKPNSFGINVREGMDLSGEVGYPILAMETVVIGGASCLFIVYESGDLRIRLPYKHKREFKVYRRYHRVLEQINIFGEGDTPPTHASIKVVGNLIYIMSDIKTWVVRGDGSFKDFHPYIKGNTSVSSDGTEFTFGDYERKSFRQYGFKKGMTVSTSGFANGANNVLDATILDCDKNTLEVSGLTSESAGESVSFLSADYCVVDALDATIYDADLETPKLFKNGNYTGDIEKNQGIYYKIRNEFGGRGSGSNIVFTNKQDGYVLAGAKGMHQYPLGVISNNVLQKDIYGYGFRHGAVSSDKASFQLSFTPEHVGTKLGYVYSDYTGMKTWTNVETTGATYGFMTGFAYVELDFPSTNSGWFPNQYDHSTSLDTWSAAPAGGCGLIRTPDGKFVLMMGDSISLHQYESYILDSYNVISGSTTVSSPYRAMLMMYVKSAPETCSAPSPMVKGSNSLGYSAVTMYLYEVDIIGMDTDEEAIIGGDYNDGTNDYGCPYKCYKVAIALDASNNPVKPVVLTEPFIGDEDGRGVPTLPDTSQTFEIQLFSDFAPQWYDDVSDDYSFYFKTNDESKLEIGKYPYTPWASQMIVLYPDNLETLTDPKKFYDVYSLGGKTDTWLAGSFENTKKNASVDYRSLDEHRVYPVALSLPVVNSADTPKSFTRNVGDWQHVETYSGRFYFSQQNVLKITNHLLEWEDNMAIEFDSTITDLKALKGALFVFTEKGIYTVDANNMADKFSEKKVKKAVLINEQLAFIDETGALFRVIYDKGSGSPSNQTSNPYLQVVESSGIIKDVTDNWSVYDMICYKDELCIATDLGVYVYSLIQNTWWKQAYPVEVYKFVEYKDSLFVFGGKWADVFQPWTSGVV